MIDKDPIIECTEILDRNFPELIDYPELYVSSIADRCWQIYKVDSKIKRIKELEKILEEYNDCIALLLNERELTLETAISLGRLKHASRTNNN